MNTKILIPLTLSVAMAALFSPAAAIAANASNAIRVAQAAVAVDSNADEQLKIAAIEALMSAPATRAVPLLRKVLDGNHSNAVKSRALFVMSQVDGEAAQDILTSMAADPTQPLRFEAIRMIGIGGSRASLARLGEIYRDGDAKTREAVLQAYLIAGDKNAVYEIARNGETEEEFSAAIQKLGAMGATKELRALADKTGATNSLIRAYAIAGDLDALRALVDNSGDPEQKSNAIRSIGIVGGSRANEALLDIYQAYDNQAIRQSALQGMLISGHDEGVLQLYRDSDDAGEKRNLLRTLVMMNSDLALDIIDSALEEK